MRCLKPYVATAMKIKLLTFAIFILVFSARELSRAQTPPSGDTSRFASKVLAEYKGLFGRPWCESFVKLWNATGDSAKVLGGMGKVYFVTLAAESIATLMDFDSLGKASLLSVSKDLPTDSTPTFTATLEKWIEFMEGKYKAVAGVLTGKIKYAGPLKVAFKYGVAFDKVAPVGKHASQLLHQKQRK